MDLDGNNLSISNFGDLKMNVVRYVAIPLFVVILALSIISSIAIGNIVADFKSKESERQSALLITSEVEIASRDLTQQITMAHMSYYQLIISTVGTILSAIGLLVLFYSLKQTREALKDNKKFGIAQTCAYLHVESVESSEIQGWILNCKNTGSSPALDVMVTSYIKTAKSPLLPHFTFPDHNDHNSGAIAAGEVRALVIRSELMELFEDKAIGTHLIVSGSIKYTDVFGTRYKSEFAAYKSNGCEQKFLIPAIKLQIHKKL